MNDEHDSFLSLTCYTGDNYLPQFLLKVVELNRIHIPFQEDSKDEAPVLFPRDARYQGVPLVDRSLRLLCGLEHVETAAFEGKASIAVRILSQDDPLLLCMSEDAWMGLLTEQEKHEVLAAMHQRAYEEIWRLEAMASAANRTERRHGRHEDSIRTILRLSEEACQKLLSA